MTHRPVKRTLRDRVKGGRRGRHPRGLRNTAPRPRVYDDTGRPPMSTKCRALPSAAS